LALRIVGLELKGSLEFFLRLVSAIVLKELTPAVQVKKEVLLRGIARWRLWLRLTGKPERRRESPGRRRDFSLIERSAFRAHAVFSVHDDSVPSRIPSEVTNDM
jgi:hypothetical protein